jgi:putative ABC transport system permease protein
MDGWWHDVRLACRGLRRARGFATIAVLTLATGIAGTSTMFALVHGVLLTPLPVRDQDRLVVLWKELPTGSAQWPFRATDVTLLRDASRTLERVAGYGYQDPLNISVIENDAASYVNLARVTGDFFDVLGVRSMLGRALTRADDVLGAEPVAVITHGLWERRYGASRDVIGRRLFINEQAFTIVGVMPRDVEYPRGVEVWVPAAPLAATVRNPVFRGAVVNELRIVARLRPTARMEQAASELRALAPTIEASAPPGAPTGLVPAVRSYEEAIVGDVRGTLLVLFVAVALVLLVATANVANLLLMRGQSRRAEFAVRAALGASSGRLAREMLAESGILSLAAAAVGLTITWAALPSILGLIPNGLPRSEAVHPDWRVVLFTFGAAFVTAALATLAPGIVALRAPLSAELRSAGRGAGGRAAQNGRRALVVVQVALAVMVVATAGLLTRSLQRLHAVATELAADRLLFVPLMFPQDKYEDPTVRLQFLTAAIEQLESVPAIGTATPVNVEPFSGMGWDAPAFTAEGQSRERAERNPSLNLEAIHYNYFDTFEVPIVRGRSFTTADRAETELVAMVSEDVASRTWPGEDPIGKRIKIGGPDSRDPWRTVVGVATPTRYRELREQRATLYVPAEQFMVTAQTLVVRTASPVAAVAPLIAERLRRVDPNVRVLRVATLGRLLDQRLARPRFNALLTAIFGTTALFLAAVGLYAVMAVYVRLREREIGIRVALGATAARVRAVVVGEAARLAIAGVAIGLGVAAMSSRLLRGLLFEVDPLDPVAIAGAAAALVGAAIIACYLPARRAMRVNPIIMLRAE